MCRLKTMIIQFYHKSNIRMMIIQFYLFQQRQVEERRWQESHFQNRVWGKWHSYVELSRFISKWFSGC
ncbi:hypothetical protein VNO78_28417 [Psophocarpus tetragonolobus]|uniref:Uncharacterized protein n=1 Tax=Psophocarpus tetragonolobus TaxID=3891 RepID=A0AAN9XBR1_PSOTE